MQKTTALILLLSAGCGQDIGLTTASACDGLLQKGEVTVDDGFDADGDGYFDARNAGCQAAYPPEQLDCDDSDPGVNPGSPELCDGLDNNCDGLVDSDDPALAEGDTHYLDQDGDGYGDPDQPLLACSEAPGVVLDSGDCDDTDASSNPAQDERCDGVDNDCDGQLDEPDAVDAPMWYQDSDQDGFGDAASGELACDAPSGFVASDQDCDDADGQVHPDADELCDGVDNNCDGATDEDQAVDALRWYQDSDSDGYGDSGQAHDACQAPSGFVAADGDCADAEPSQYPGAPELCDDGLVNDCELSQAEASLLCGPHGTEPLAQADALLIGEGISDEAGWSLAGVGDANNDGYDDVLVGAANDDDGGVDAGAAYLLNGPLTGTIDLSAADAKLVGEAADDLAGWSVAGAGDVNNDGVGDLLVGAFHNDRALPAAGATYLLLGPVTGTVDLSGADAILTGAGNFSYSGRAVAGAGDTNNDGYDDILVGAPFADGSGSNSGISYLVLGPVTGEQSLDDADARLYGEQAFDRSGWPVAYAGDLNADGNDDVLVSAYREDSGGTDAGASYLLFGPVSGDINLGDANGKMVGENPDDYAGQALGSGGDVNNDGYDDLLIGAYLEDSAGNNAGIAYLFLGPVSGDFDMSLADARLTGEGSNQYAGWSVAGAGDVDSDGYDDILVGAYGSTTGGSAYLWTGPVTGTHSLTDAEAKMTGVASQDKAGWAVAGAGDTNGNGHADVLVGAPYNNAGGADAGAAYLMLGAGI